MWPDQTQWRLSNVGVALLVASLGAGGGIMAVTGSRAPLAAGALVGLYFLFSIRVADHGRELRCYGSGASGDCAAPVCSTWSRSWTS
jgi:hypothetical protein